MNEQTQAETLETESPSGVIEGGVEQVADPAIEADNPGQSESSTDGGENRENKTEFTAEQQEIFNREIGKKTFKIREAERRAEELAAKLKETESRLPAQTRPDVPPMPDQFDDNFDQRVQERDQAILAQAQFDAAQRIKTEQQQQAAQAKQRQEQEALVKSAESYRNNAIKRGVDMAELQAAGAQVSAFGLRNDVAGEILTDEMGPNITLYLAKNPQVMQELNSASPIRAGALYDQIRANASGMSKKVTTPPDPVEPLSGTGVPPKDRGPSGATYE